MIVENKKYLRKLSNFHPVCRGHRKNVSLNFVFRLHNNNIIVMGTVYYSTIVGIYLE